MLQLYKNIKEKRITMGLTQEDLAKKTGYTNRTSIAKIEQGDFDLSVSKIISFAKALNCTPLELMGLDGEINTSQKINAFSEKKNDDSTLTLSSKEKLLIIKYREKKHMQEAVNKLLGIQNRLIDSERLVKNKKDSEEPTTIKALLTPLLGIQEQEDGDLTEDELIAEVFRGCDFSKMDLAAHKKGKLNRRQLEEIKKLVDMVQQLEEERKGKERKGKERKGKES